MQLLFNRRHENKMSIVCGNKVFGHSYSLNLTKYGLNPLGCTDYSGPVGPKGERTLT